MRGRYRVALWGKGLLPPDFEARIGDGLPVVDEVAARIAKRMRLCVCGGPRREPGCAQVALGRSLGRGAGFTDIREVWFSVKRVKS